MFKKDEYIITLELKKYYIDFCAKENYCFKVERDCAYLTMYKDLQEEKNGHSVLKFDKSRVLVDWRYATTEEAEHYELIDKPYDVTTLPKFILPHNWHILVTEENAIDVLTWRFEESFETKDNIKFLDQIVGMDGYGHKGHNPKDEIKSEGSYDFGNEITYYQFKKYVLNKHVDKEDLSYLVKFLDKLNMT